jgi:hypothetical protein
MPVHNQQLGIEMLYTLQPSSLLLCPISYLQQEHRTSDYEELNSSARGPSSGKHQEGGQVPS